MRRVLPVAVAAAALLFSQLPASTALVAPGDQALSAKAGPAKVRTEFALATSAYGTRVQGGAIPANSRDTAYERIGCTNVAGAETRNYEADLTIPGLGKVEGVGTRVWTEKKGDTVSSYSQHSIAKVTIGAPSIGALEIYGLSSTSRAFNKNGRFGTTVDNQIARIVLRAAGQAVRELKIPAPGRTLTIPGLASISLGKSVRSITGSSARISSNVLDVSVIPLGTRVRVAQTNASIQKGIAQGIFRGYGAGVEARAIADNLKVGRTPLTLLPCTGTKGRTRSKAIAGVDLGDLGTVRAVASSTKGTNRARVAKGTATGRVAGVSLLGGRIQVKGIVAVANVKRERGKITRNSNGSAVLDLVIDGRTVSFPALGAIEIPGLAKLQGTVEQRTKHGLKVIGLRVTLLDGTGAVVDLGVADIGIRPGAPARR